MARYNLKQYHDQLYGAEGSLISVLSTDLLVFEGFSLSDLTSTTTTDLLDSTPTRELSQGKVPRDDGKNYYADYWRDKRIEARGLVEAATQLALDQYLDTIRKNLRKPNGNLDVTRPGMDTRRYIATLDNPETLFADRERTHITICPFHAIFTCLSPFGEDIDYTAQSVSVTASPQVDAITNGGTIEAKPVFVFAVNAANTVTVLNIQNDTTGDEIEYSGTVAAGDVFVFDSENLQVLKNSVAVDYTGVFPKLDVGSNVLRFTVTGTSFDIRVTTKMKRRWL